MGTFLSCWFACPAPLKGARFMLCAVWAGSPLAYGRVPYPPYARCGMGRLCGERRWSERCERIHAQETRLAAGGGESRRNYALPAPSEAPPRAPAPVAAGASPRPPRAPWGRGWPGMLRASVSSVLPTQETRLGAGGGCRRALRPHQPSEVWRAAALQNVFVSPGFAGRAGSLRPWAQTFLTPAAACAEGKRVPCGHLREAQSDP